MADCLPTLAGMTISKILSRRRNGTRLPIGDGLASVNICGNSLMRGLPLSWSLWKRPLLSIEQTCRWNKLRLQNIQQFVGRRNGRPKMGPINWKIQNLLKKPCQKRMMPYMQVCFGKCERLSWEGLHHWGEHVREALRGTSSQRFTVSPASISNFWGFVVWFLGCFCFGFFCFGVGLCLCFCLWLPHEWDLLSCVRIVCNLERPSELSWRARHGRKKNHHHV